MRGGAGEDDLLGEEGDDACDGGTNPAGGPAEADSARDCEEDHNVP